MTSFTARSTLISVRRFSKNFYHFYIMKRILNFAIKDSTAEAALL